jgi:hypothetical protein
MSEQENLRQQINQETAVFPWRELLRYFAGGHCVYVDAGLDLVEVGVQMASNQAGQIQIWLEQGKIAKVSDEQAQLWLEHDANLWTVVVKPWILVQTSPVRDTSH